MCMDTNMKRAAKQPKKKAKEQKEPTELILELAEFDVEAQRTTREDVMCKDLKLLMRTVTKMDTMVHAAIAALDLKIQDLTEKFDEHIQEFGQRISTDATSATAVNEQMHPLSCHLPSLMSCCRSPSPLNYFQHQRCCHHYHCNILCQMVNHLSQLYH